MNKRLLIQIFGVIWLMVPSLVALNQIAYAQSINNIHVAPGYNLKVTRSTYIAGLKGYAVGDIDGNGKKDLIVGDYSDYNSGRSLSGSVYVVLDSILESKMGLTESLDLSVASNYNLKIIGATAGMQLSDGGIDVADINGDDKDDIVVGSWSNILYVVTSDILNADLTPGTVLDLASPSSYKVKFSGASQESFAVEMLTEITCLISRRETGIREMLMCCLIS